MLGLVCQLPLNNFQSAARGLQLAEAPFERIEPRGRIRSGLPRLLVTIPRRLPASLRLRPASRRPVNVILLIDPLPDAATLEVQRRDVANAVSTLAMVDRAVWSTNSTLEVILLARSGQEAGALRLAQESLAAGIYDHDLVSSRIQLTPPPGSDAQVRFRQCRSY